MRKLTSPPLSAEQHGVVGDPTPGVVGLHGPAGSGKTAVAIRRAAELARVRLREREEASSSEPVRVTLLVYDTPLVGYVGDVVAHHLPRHPLLRVRVETPQTFNRSVAKYHGLTWPKNAREKRIWELGEGLGLSHGRLRYEVDQVLGTYHPDRLNEYITGHPTAPAFNAHEELTPELRRAVVDRVVVPLHQFKAEHGLVDDHDLAAMAAAAPSSTETQSDILVVDDAQHASATQVRAIARHTAPEHASTFVFDDLPGVPSRATALVEHTHHLSRGWRCPGSVVALATGILGSRPQDGIALHKHAAAEAPRGTRPTLWGDPRRLIHHLVRQLEDLDPVEQSALVVSFGGPEHLSQLRLTLDAAGIDFAELDEARPWPADEPGVAIAEPHAVTGLEFDHVAVLDINAEQATASETARHGVPLEVLRRALATTVLRARKSVTLGYDARKPPGLARCIEPATVVDVPYRYHPNRDKPDRCFGRARPAL